MIKETSSMAERLAEMVARHPAVASGVAGGAATAGGEAVMRASDDNQWSSQPLSARLKYLMDAHKRPSLLNNKMACFVAQSMADDMEKSAAGLGGTLSALLRRGAGAASGLASKAAPALDSGFAALGGQAFRHIPEGSLPAKALFGNGGIVPRVEQGEETLMNLPQLGKTVAKRVGIGAGGALGGTLAVEAPGKMQDNAAYAQQQQHPIRSWLAQRLAGAPKLQSRSYMNPFS